MAIATYSDLVKQVKAWSNRQDLTDDEIESFTYLAGSMASQLLRVVPMEMTTLIDVEPDGHCVIPPDFQQLRSLTYEFDSETSIPLAVLAWDQFVNLRNDPELQTNTRWYARQGGYWFLAPTPEEQPFGSPKKQVTCHYYRTMPDINPAEQTNWLIDMSPMAYLFGSLHFLYLYVFDEERAAYWHEKFTGELQRIQNLNDGAEYQGTTLTVRPRHSQVGDTN